MIGTKDLKPFTEYIGYAVGGTIETGNTHVPRLKDPEYIFVVDDSSIEDSEAIANKLSQLKIEALECADQLADRMQEIYRVHRISIDTNETGNYDQIILHREVELSDGIDGLEFGRYYKVRLKSTVAMSFYIKLQNLIEQFYNENDVRSEDEIEMIKCLIAYPLDKMILDDKLLSDKLNDVINYLNGNNYERSN